jgi:hypothetical protein
VQENVALLKLARLAHFFQVVVQSAMLPHV